MSLQESWQTIWKYYCRTREQFDLNGRLLPLQRLGHNSSNMQRLEAKS